MTTARTRSSTTNAPPARSGVTRAPLASAPLCDTARATARSFFAAAPIEAHPFLRALRDGSLTPAEARHAALDLAHVVAAFPRFLAGLIANVPSWTERMDLVENLYEEHGRMDPKRVHEVTYRDFLATLGLDEPTIAAHRPSLGVIVYVRAMSELCSRGRVAEALGALAVIEEIVARASVSVRTWASVHAPAREHHFSVHETLDLQHADELFALCEPHFVHDAEAVRHGMELGRYYHARLYDDVWAAARGASRTD